MPTEKARTEAGGSPGRDDPRVQAALARLSAVIQAIVLQRETSQSQAAAAQLGEAHRLKTKSEPAPAPLSAGPPYPPAPRPPTRPKAGGCSALFHRSM
jgi:hypothetical protein